MLSKTASFVSLILKVMEKLMVEIDSWMKRIVLLLFITVVAILEISVMPTNSTFCFFNIKL